MRTSRTTRSGSSIALVQRRQRRDAVLRDLDLVPLELERTADRTPQRTVVVDDEDPSHGRRMTALREPALNRS